MFERLRTQIGTAGLIVAIVALVVALGGGAYAATSGSGSGKATASAKAKKGPRGPKGNTGPAGAQGLPGAPGAKGDTGSSGSNGKDGAKGADGANGKDGSKGADGASVVSSAESAGLNCANGGSKFVAGGSTTYACNGANGTTGFTDTLPSGKTETGAWAFQPGSSSGLTWVPISFPIPLAAALDGSHVHYIASGTTADCPGSVADPQAAAGHLCVYQGSILNAQGSPFGVVNTPAGTGAGASKAGATLGFQITAAGGQGQGTFAVKSP